jgi:PAS domain S-box-containing protein
MDKRLVPDRTDAMRRLVDHVPSMLAYWDAELRCRFANRAYETWFGVNADQLIGTSLRDLLGPELFALNEPFILAALGGEEQTFERVIPGPDGIHRHSLANYRPDVIGGHVVGFIASVTQVTQLKQIEADLRASEAFLERIGRVAGVGGWSLDLATNAIAWTSQTYRIHEVDKTHHPTVENGIQFYAPEARPIISAAVESAIKDGTSWDLKLPFFTAKGRLLWVRTFGEVEFDGGRPVRIVGAFQDVTEYRQRRVQLEEEQALRQQAEHHAEELQALLSERGRMLDVLAHEVRQPLHNASVALQSAHQVLAGRGGTAAFGPLERVQAVIAQVTSSIDNTLAVASLLARPDPIRLEDTDIDTALAMVVEDLSADERGRIVIDRQTSTRTILADMSLVRLALRNLLANALRHGGSDNPVTIRVSDSDEPLATFIDVVDAGAGVDAAIAGRLFERGARSSASSGYGLGLVIVQRVMELHGGHAILVSNAPGRVVFRLSFEQALDE